MPSANTHPEPIVDKNGKLTTVHKSSEPKTTGSVSRVASVVSPQAKGGFDLSTVNAGSSVTHKLNDEIFDTVSIARGEDGSLVATGEFTIDEDALDTLRDEVGDLGKYLSENSDDIKSYIRTEYGASSVEVSPDNESIVASYEVSVSDDKLDADALLDDFYNTRAVSLHSHAYGSDSLSYGISEFVSATDTEYVEPRAGRAAFDDEI